MKKHLLTICAVISIASLQAAVTEVSSISSLNAQLKNGKPSAVCFYSPGCPHCVAYKPRFEKLSNKYNGVNFILVNMQKNSAVGAPYNVSGVPRTVVFDASGNQTGVVSGNKPADLEKQLKPLSAAAA